jgi:hypothetical protein
MQSGFNFSSAQGFTGSTGNVTSVTAYTRRKGYASGGFVKEGYQPKVEKVGDSGHATTLRSQPSTNLDQETGGKTPLRPGYKKGGKAKKAMGGALGAALASAVGRAKPQGPMPGPTRSPAPRLTPVNGPRMIKRDSGGRVGSIARLVKGVMGKMKTAEQAAPSVASAPKPSIAKQPATAKPRGDVTNYGYLDRRSGERRYFASDELRNQALKRRGDLEGLAFFNPIDSGTLREKKGGGTVKMRRC